MARSVGPREGDTFPAVVESPKAYLAPLATRIAIDHLRSARVRRESYFGTWLPEPVVRDGELAADQEVERAESLSMAFMLMLEALTPVERAVFLLRELASSDDLEPRWNRETAQCANTYCHGAGLTGGKGIKPRQSLVKRRPIRMPRHRFASGRPA